MSDLICRKNMMRCQTPGMCAPHGGCSTSAEAARAALVERAVAPAPASGVPGTIGVKRYIPDGYTQPASRSGTGTHMVESRDGDYVLASDYDALAQRCRELEAENSEFRKLPTCWSEVFEQTTELERAEFERDTLRAEVEQARRTAEYWKAEHLAGSAVIDQLRTAIADPESVFANMKRGTIAKPGLRSMIDLYGEVPNGDETQLLEIAQLRAEVERLRSLPARLQQIVTTRHESTAALAARVRNTLEDYQ